MAYTTTPYYSSSKDTRYTSTKAPANAPVPPYSFGVYKISPQYSVGHPTTAPPHPTYPNTTIHRSQAPSQYYQQSHSSYPSSHSSSKSYDSNDASGYASSHSSASSGTMAPPTYPASPMRPYSCDQCALSFDRSHDLKRHRDSHSGAKPFECNSCRRSFTRKDALKRHQSQKHCGLEDA